MDRRLCRELSAKAFTSLSILLISLVILDPLIIYQGSAIEGNTIIQGRIIDISSRSQNGDSINAIITKIIRSNPQDNLYIGMNINTGSSSNQFQKDDCFEAKGYYESSILSFDYPNGDYIKKISCDETPSPPRPSCLPGPVGSPQCIGNTAKQLYQDADCRQYWQTIDECDRYIPSKCCNSGACDRCDAQETYQCSNNMVQRLVIKNGIEEWQVFDDCNKYDPPRRCIGGICVKDDNALPVENCDQAGCQAQNGPIGKSYAKDGKTYQRYQECNCTEGECRCETVEREVRTCDHQSCQANSKAVGDAYVKDGKIYQEFSECDCEDGKCRCEEVPKVIGKSDSLPCPNIILPRGSATFKPPDAKSLINTSKWGNVPANQVVITAHEGTSIDDIKALASLLDGQIVGYDDSINLYQIETSGKTEAELEEAIFKAKESTDIDLAFPNQEINLYQSPLSDPIYGGYRGKSYEIVGVQKAWDIINSSGLALFKVRVGVSDDGLYRGFGEFSGKSAIDTKDKGAELEKPMPTYSFVGSHGTGVMNVLAADPDNGGLVGIASKPLGKRLTVYMTNIYSPQYTSTEKGYFSGALEALTEEVSWQAEILSVSWGTREADPALVDSFRQKMIRWSEVNPDVLLICAVPDDVPIGEDKRLNGSRCCPSGLDLPNVITVGSINNSGKIVTSCMSSPNYKIDLAAPGEDVVYYRDDTLAYNNKPPGGTSMAAPMVAAAAAMIRSLNDSLNAVEIKAILVETARTSIDIDGKQVPVPEEVGGRVLAIDQAVKKVVEDRRNRTTK